MTERWVETRVGRLKVDLEGDRARPAAVLWHSLFMDGRSWGRVEASLAQDRRLVIVTGPGHGGSGDPGRRYSMDDCAEAAVEVLDAVGASGPVDWVGNAWGGHVGIVLAGRHPDRVRTLVAAGTPLHRYRLPDRLSTSLLLLLYRWFGPIRPVTGAVVGALLSERTRRADPTAVELVRDSFVRADRRRMANAVTSISLRRLDAATALASITAPTLLVTGSDHPDWSPEQARAAAASLADGAVEVIGGAAYLVPLEAPDAFSGSVRRFWAARSARNG